ncbi:unnamed protein product [Ostreobium quekettii]|uniref:Uncharacterized protein n=1 Tax=Ostreobium quekettii TaxID=121088 RepID=A0A8S1JFY6_9CHLO|nr:unnamed protein product [Ostreobium quekettii]
MLGGCFCLRWPRRRRCRERRGPPARAGLCANAAVGSAAIGEKVQLGSDGIRDVGEESVGRGMAVSNSGLLERTCWRWIVFIGVVEEGNSCKYLWWLGVGSEGREVVKKAAFWGMEQGGDWRPLPAGQWPVPAVAVVSGCALGCWARWA